MQKLAKAVSDLVVALIEFDLKLVLLFLEYVELALKRIDAGTVGRRRSRDNLYNLASGWFWLWLLFGFNLVVAAFGLALRIGAGHWRKQDFMNGAVDLHSKLLRAGRHLESKSPAVHTGITKSPGRDESLLGGLLHTLNQTSWGRPSCSSVKHFGYGGQIGFTYPFILGHEGLPGFGEIRTRGSWHRY